MRAFYDAVPKQLPVYAVKYLQLHKTADKIKSAGKELEVKRAMQGTHTNQKRESRRSAFLFDVFRKMDRPMEQCKDIALEILTGQMNHHLENDCPTFLRQRLDKEELPKLAARMRDVVAGYRQHNYHLTFEEYVRYQFRCISYRRVEWDQEYIKVKLFGTEAAFKAMGDYYERGLSRENPDDAADVRREVWTQGLRQQQNSREGRKELE